MIFLAKRYPPKTARAIPKIIKAGPIHTITANHQNHKAQTISPILPTNSKSQEITPLSFGFAYQVTRADVTGDSNAIIREIKKVRITIAKNHVQTPRKI